VSVLRSSDLKDDLWMMNWKLCGNKSWPVLRNCLCICLQGLRETSSFRLLCGRRYGLMLKASYLVSTYRPCHTNAAQVFDVTYFRFENPILMINTKFFTCHYLLIFQLKRRKCPFIIMPTLICLSIVCCLCFTL
jgi:hypothetical protein